MVCEVMDFPTLTTVFLLGTLDLVLTPTVGKVLALH
jgi:hypothetical protein